LKTFSDVAKGALRQSDLMARWGGEEFAFAFANITPAAASDAIDRIRLQLAARLATSDLPSFTVSFGIVASGDCASLEDAVRFADDALYEAKNRGRDCSVIADTSELEPGTATAAPSVRIAERLRGTGDGVMALLVRDDDPLES